MNQPTVSTPFLRTWDRLPLLFRAIVSGSLVSSVGVFTWGALISRFMSPWTIFPMIIALWVFWRFFSGHWGAKTSVASRKERFRQIKLSSAIWKWGIIGAILFVIIVQGSFVLTFRLIEFPTRKFTADYKMLDKVPLWVAWVILVMSSVVAGICEETGFRGYMQVPLEKRYGAITAIILTSIIFTLIHMGHSWAFPILPHIFFASVLLGILAYRSNSLIPGIIGHSILDIFDYSVWWTDLTGKFERQTIFKDGMDLHFILWTLVLLLAIFGYFQVMARLKMRVIGS